MHGFTIAVTLPHLALMVVGVVIGIHRSDVLRDWARRKGCRCCCRSPSGMQPSLGDHPVASMYWGAMFGGLRGPSICSNITDEAVVGRDHVRRLSDGPTGGRQPRSPPPSVRARLRRDGRRHTDPFWRQGGQVALGLRAGLE